MISVTKWTIRYWPRTRKGDLHKGQDSLRKHLPISEPSQYRKARNNRALNLTLLHVQQAHSFGAPSNLPIDPLSHLRTIKLPNFVGVTTAHDGQRIQTVAINNDISHYHLATVRTSFSHDTHKPSNLTKGRWIFCHRQRRSSPPSISFLPLVLHHCRNPHPILRRKSHLFFTLSSQPILTAGIRDAINTTQNRFQQTLQSTKHCLSTKFDQQGS